MQTTDSSVASCECGCHADDGCSSCIFVQPEQNNPLTRTNEDVLSARENKVLEVMLRLERATPQRVKELARKMRLVK